MNSYFYRSAVQLLLAQLIVKCSHYYNYVGVIAEEIAQGLVGAVTTVCLEWHSGV